MVTPACSSSGNRSGLLGGRGIKATAKHSMGQNSLGDPLGFWEENVERMIKERHGQARLGLAAAGRRSRGGCLGRGSFDGWGRESGLNRLALGARLRVPLSSRR